VRRNASLGEPVKICGSGDFSEMHAQGQRRTRVVRSGDRTPVIRPGRFDARKQPGRMGERKVFVGIYARAD
jgi:hypothetical protein